MCSLRGLCSRVVCGGAVCRADASASSCVIRVWREPPLRLASSWRLGAVAFASLGAWFPSATPSSSSRCCACRAVIARSRFSAAGAFAVCCPTRPRQRASEQQRSLAHPQPAQNAPKSLTAFTTTRARVAFVSALELLCASASVRATTGAENSPMPVLFTAATRKRYRWSRKSCSIVHDLQCSHNARVPESDVLRESKSESRCAARMNVRETRVALVHDLPAALASDAERLLHDHVRCAVVFRCERPLQAHALCISATHHEVSRRSRSRCMTSEASESTSAR